MMNRIFHTAALILGLACAPARADFDTGLSSTTRRMLSDLESLSRAERNGRGADLFQRFYDGTLAASAVQVRGPYVVQAHAIHRGGATLPPRRGGTFRNPGIPPRRGGVPYPYPRYPGYPGYYPPPRTAAPLGERVVNFFNHAEAAVNNFRDALAQAIAPEYPYVTRYYGVDNGWGRDEAPVYRYRSGPYDIPSRYLPYGYGYYGSSPYGRNGPIGGVGRYEGGYGWVPPFGLHPNYRYEPGVGLVQTWEKR